MSEEPAKNGGGGTLSKIAGVVGLLLAVGTYSEMRLRENDRKIQDIKVAVTESLTGKASKELYDEFKNRYERDIAATVSYREKQREDINKNAAGISTLRSNLEETEQQFLALNSGTRNATAHAQQLFQLLWHATMKDTPMPDLPDVNGAFIVPTRRSLGE